jgi:phosphatidylglycerol:prolipoprotein diacylglycerol transferase
MPLTVVIDLNPNLFRIGPFLITWHGVFAVLGILVAARLGLWLLAKDGVDTSRSADGVAWMVVLGLVGARLLYVWENFRIFAGGNLLRVFALTEGGISQWGGLFGAMVGAYVWARRAKMSYWKLIDASGAAAMIGLAVGRIGDVINGEHHGTPTNAPWGVEYVNPATLGDPGVVVHPEVAYEMVLTLALLGALLPFHQRLKARLPDGVLGLVYLGLYAAGRFFLSFYRTDPAVFAGLRQAQLASLLMVVIAAVAIPVLYRRARGASGAIAAPPAAAGAIVEEPAAVETTIDDPDSGESIAKPAPVEPETSAVAEPAQATPGRASSRHGPRRARPQQTRPPQSTP